MTTTKKPPEITIDITGWSVGDWPKEIAKAVKVKTGGENLVTIYLDEDALERTVKTVIQGSFEVLCSAESEADFSLTSEGLRMTLAILSRPILIPWASLSLNDKAALLQAGRWLEQQAPRLDD